MKKTFITLEAPEGATSVHHDGEDYEVEEDGVIAVPSEAAEQLIGAHGYRPVGTAAAVTAKANTENGNQPPAGAPQGAGKAPWA